MIRNATRGTVLADQERWALASADRMRGLLDRDGLDPGEALVIRPCTSVHMFGMAFPLDVVFVDRGGRVVRTYENLRPWRASWIHFFARDAIELPVGVVAASGTKKGDLIEYEPSP